MLFQVSSIITKVETMVDGGCKIVATTQELTPDESMSLFSLKGKLGWLLFSENSIVVNDIPDEPAPEFDGDKSPSQRLRSMLYVYWKENTKQTIPFNTFYGQWIDKKINEIKETLPDKV